MDRNKLSMSNDPRVTFFRCLSLYHGTDGTKTLRKASGAKEASCENNSSKIKMTYSCDGERKGQFQGDKAFPLPFSALAAAFTLAE
mmetsp:Transcript_4994/g.7259  ORF Transcript_4994/g.7259 Transcript_4994/m.7259 type:complete len:86 (-) Transcript_4994:320-577(-)